MATKKSKSIKKTVKTEEPSSLFEEQPKVKKVAVKSVKAITPKRRTVPFNLKEANDVLYSMDTKGIRNCDIIAANPIANCKEDYSKWISKHS